MRFSPLPVERHRLMCLEIAKPVMTILEFYKEARKQHQFVKCNNQVLEGGLLTC